MRTALLALSALIFVQDGPRQAPKVIDKPETRGIGREVKDFGQLDGLLKESKAVVLAFSAPDCPVSKLYLPKLSRMAADLNSKGVRLALVFCNIPDKFEPPKLDIPVILDRDSKIVAQLDVQRTTEALLIDSKRILRYRGAVDDQYGIGYERDSAAANYLLDAVEALLAGAAPKIAATEAPGCAVERAAPPAAAGAVTYHKDVEPILQRRCQECHRPGMIGPFSLLTYQQARAASRRMKEVVSQRRMPPWHADPKHGDWENSRRMSDDEIGAIVKWIDSGTPEGDAKDAPPPKQFVDGWTIGEPDLVVKMQEEYQVKAEGTIPYQYYRVPTGLKEDKWVQAMEVRAGAREVVHHILVFVEYPRGRKGEQPPIDGGLFYGYFAVLVPGERPMVYADGLGKPLPAGSFLIFQIHYTANGKATRDRSSIGLVWSKTPVKHEVVTRGIVDQRLSIPPGAESHREEGTYTFTHDAKILSFLPHMHLRGKSFRYVMVKPDGSEEILLDVPQYDFRWQHTYRYREPLFVKHGTKIRAIAHFDNSKKNPANPDPSKTVKWGQQSWEEMLIGYMDFIKVEE